MDQSQQGQSTNTQSSQSAQADLKAAADRAKAATAGYQFAKLFEGRIDNMNYLYAAIGSIVVGLILNMIPIIGLIASLALMVLGFGLTIRRFHDIHIIGWASLILIVPFVGLLAVIYLCWKHGDTGTNQYGAAPDPKRDFFKAALNT